MIKRVLISSFVFCHLCGHAQRYSISDSLLYKRGIVLFNDGEKEAAENIIRSKESLILNANALNEKTYPLNSIKYVKLKTGTKAGKGAIIGGLTASAIVFGAILNVATDDDLVFKENATKNALLMVGGGLGIGLIIGSSQPKFKTVFPNL